MSRQSAFTLLFWGFFFILLDFYIQNVNILPNTVGYIFIAIAANRLGQENGWFRTVYGLSLPMILLSIPNFYKTQSAESGINATIPSITHPLLILLSILTWILSLVLVYHVCKGVAQMAREHDAPELEVQSTTRWQMYLWLQLSTAFTMALAFGHAGLAIPLVILVFIYAIVVMIAFLTWLRRCRATL